MSCVAINGALRDEKRDYTIRDGFCVPLLLQDEPKPSTSRQSPRNSDSSRLDFFSMPSRAFEKAEELARRVWAAGWMVVHHNHLPKWLRDNDFLVKGHRPPMNSYWKCFKSVFRVHTETGNIWTHLLGMKVHRLIDNTRPLTVAGHFRFVCIILQNIVRLTKKYLRVTGSVPYRSFAAEGCFRVCVFFLFFHPLDFSKLLLIKIYIMIFIFLLNIDCNCISTKCEITNIDMF